MTDGVSRKEIIERLSKFVGLRVTETDRAEKLEVKSPNGMILFHLNIFRPNPRSAPNRWAFGGTSSVLPDQWTKLCRIAD